MVILEEIQDIVSWLFNDALSEVSSISSDDSQEVSDFIVKRASETFPDDNILPEVERVIVFKVVGDEINHIDSDHYVVRYNGDYYDYTASQYNEEFRGLIKESDLPVVQRVIVSDRQINQGVSTVKGYVLLRYSDV